MELEIKTPLLSDNPVIITLLLTFLLINILSWRKEGMMRRQLQWIRDTRNARTFDTSDTTGNRLQMLILFQLFLFSGLSLFCISQPNPAQQLSDPGVPDILGLAVCILAPLLWYWAQQFCFNWANYLFDGGHRIIIMNRIYLSIHTLAGPAAMLVFLLQVTCNLSSHWIAFLLTATFIVSQFAFIFSGIKIFWTGFGTLFYLIMYLCALEIAPLLLICQKLL